jgi:hypothetical protein
MLSEDYFMRMINQALAVLMTALGLKRAGQFSEALQAFDQAIEGLLGLDAQLAKQLDDGTLLGMLTFQEQLDAERLLVLAEIYKEEAEVYARQGQPATSRSMLLSCLRFYLEATLANEANHNLDLIQKIEALRRNYAAADLPVETRLALLDYLERLLTLGDDFLEAAGLSRSDLEATFSVLGGWELQ